MARGQLLSLILARQHQKVADPWSRVMTKDPVVQTQKFLTQYRAYLSLDSEESLCMIMKFNAVTRYGFSY